MVNNIQYGVVLDYFYTHEIGLDFSTHHFSSHWITTIQDSVSHGIAPMQYSIPYTRRSKIVEKRTNVWPLIQKRTKCIRHLVLFINLLNSANLSLISEVTLILTIRLTVQYRDKYLRQGKNHHKNKNELLLLGHNLKIALVSFTRFSLEKRKNPSWKVLDVGCAPLSSLMGFVIFFSSIFMLKVVTSLKESIFASQLHNAKETSKCFLWRREGNKNYFRDEQVLCHLYS